MYKNILDAVENMEWLAIVLLLLFFFVFTFVIYRVIRANTPFMDKMASLPLENDSLETNETHRSNENSI